MHKIRFAVVGCGHIAKKHIEAIQNIREAELAAVCDTDPQRLKLFRDTYQAPGYFSLDELLEKEPGVDVINICTPSGLHAPLAVQAANAKKHLIVEKPIALTLEDADAVINACEKNGVKLSVVHPNRFRPAVIQLKKAMDEGLFGKLSHANATVRWNRNQAYYDQAPWRGTKAMDGGVLMNQAIHNLDLLLWLAGPVEEVQAYTATRLRNIEAEDVAAAILKFASGALGMIEAATTVYPENYEESLSLFGETGSAKIGGKTANWIQLWVFEGMSEEESRKIITALDQEPYGVPGHECIIRDMVCAIHENRAPVITGEDGRNAVKLVLAICAAAERRKPVRWDEL